MSARAAQASTSGTGDVVTEVSMDPNLWNNLENELKDMSLIYLKLPFREFFQHRVVCKEWHRLASDRELLEASFTELTPKPYFVLEYREADRYGFPRQGLLSYNASSNRWSWSWLPMLSTGGTLATEGLIYSPDIDQVINLHTRVFHILPPPPVGPPWPNVGMTLDRSEIPYTFQIVLGRENHTMIYSSRTNSWTLGRSCQLPSGRHLPWLDLISPTSCAHCNGFLYITGPGYRDRDHYQDWAMRYDLERDVWAKIILPAGYRDWYVGTWLGRLFGVSTGTVVNGTVKVKVWELITDQSEQDWTEVACMPERLCGWLKVYVDKYHDFGFGMTRRLTTTGCSFCGEYVLLYTSQTTVALADIRFVMCNLDSRDGDPRKLVWTKGQVPLQAFSIRKERDWESKPDRILRHLLQ